MTYSARILADSISPDHVRLTTLEVTFPRIVLAEFNTHRMLSRNSASSRAIPVAKMIRMVEENPYIPTYWGKNQNGMQAEHEVDEVTAHHARDAWLRARDFAVARAQELLDLGIHKQITNRLLESYMWHTCIVTATEWDNFFHLRAHPDAQPEIKRPAELMIEALAASEPLMLDYGMWHMPMIQGDLIELTDVGWTMDDLRKISTGRCARISYLTHDGKRDPSKDVGLHDDLLTGGHMSPFEHVARPMHYRDDVGVCVNGDAFDGSFQVSQTFCGNFRGWVQYRKTIPNEHDVLGAPC